MTVRHPLGGLGVVLATVTLGLAAGPVGAAVGLVTAGGWAVVPATYAFAAGQVLVAAALPAAPSTPAMIAVEAGLFAVLAGPLVTVERPVRTLGTFVVVAIGLAAVPVAFTTAGKPLWQAAVTLAVLAAALAYVSHRYERVALGLVEEVA